jgi:hypothetical protein
VRQVRIQEDVDGFLVSEACGLAMSSDRVEAECGLDTCTTEGVRDDVVFAGRHKIAEGFVLAPQLE